MNTEREDFEKKFPIPHRVKYSQRQNKYVPDSNATGEDFDIAGIYEARWQTWQADLANKPEAEPVAKYTGMGKIKWLKDGEMSLNQLLYTAPPSTAAVQTRLEELEAVTKDLAAIVRVQNGNLHEDINTLLDRADNALKASDVQAPKEVVYKLTDAQIESIALLDKYWVGGFRNEKFDWMNFAKDVLKQAAPTDKEVK